MNATYLTPRQLQSIGEYALHGNAKAAAHCMGISQSTFRAHIGHVAYRLGTSGVNEAWRALGWLVVPTNATLHDREHQ